MRDVLRALDRGELSIEEAEARLSGYATGEAGRFDAARERRRGIPEAILCPGKTDEEVASLATLALETTGRALLTRADADLRDSVRERCSETHGDLDVRTDDRASAMALSTGAFSAPEVDATVGVVSAGTADAAVAGEAAFVAREVGPQVERTDDVGVANLTRVTDELATLRACDVLVVAAGREGALPTVVAGLVSAPVIGLPVSTGYGFGGEGEAALLGMLQSCTVLSVVNVDAGFVAGAQAGLIARAIACGRGPSVET
jgi:pyridinium-3,5-biscarboxylic acid mononucleotide synthase